jgi:glycosyltransferase involved in cell wall biosynthesis
MSPIFSVVVPLYNKPLSISRCVSSILKSIGDKEIEVIIVNDGSTDNSAQIAADLASSDRRIVVLTKPNGGVSSARNAGIDLAKGTHILLLDADDRWSENHLDVMQRLIEQYPDAALYATSYECHTDDGSFTPNMVGVPPSGNVGVLGSMFLSLAYGAMPVSSSSVCVPRRIWEKVGGFKTGVGHGEDKIFWVEAALHGPVAMANIVTAHYHLDAENRSIATWTPDKGLVFRDRLLAIKETLGKFPAVTVDVDHITECIMSETYKLGKICGSLGFGKHASEYKEAAAEVAGFIDQLGVRPTFEFPSTKRSEFLEEISVSNQKNGALAV